MTERLDQLAAAIRVYTDSRLWAIDQRLLPALAQLNGADIPPVEAAERSRHSRLTVIGDTAIVPLKGVLMPGGMDFLSWLFGMESGLEVFRSRFAEAVEDPQVETVVIDVDSPGGAVDLIPETAQMIRDGRQTKPIVAVSDTQAASAAYWLASQADEIVVSPSATVGSVGVYRLHIDESEALRMEGLQPTFIAAGDHKVEGNRYQPLDEDARAAWQADVDDYYRMFVRAVAAGRGVAVPPLDGQAFGAGRSLHAKQAVTAGLADRVGTLEQTVKRVQSIAGRAALDRRRAEAGGVIEADGLKISAESGPEEIVPDPPGTDTSMYTPEEKERLLTVLG